MLNLNSNYFAFRKYQKIAEKILSLDASYRHLSDNQLKDKTVSFRKRLKQGVTLDKLLVEAFATVREADYRVLGMRPFDNQVLGAVVIHFGNVAEMKTGEGKTLTATMPLYLNALLGPGTFLVTANGYLANRDAESIGKVYRWLGLTVTSGVPKDDEETDKQAIYKHDIVYTTNSAMGFDYLLDNLAENDDERRLGELRFALVDEVDSVLLDLAQTPLVISGAPKVQSNLFLSADKLVKSLIEGQDYEISEDTKSSWFTDDGITNIQSYLGISGLLSVKYEEMYRHLVLALRANTLMHINRDYVVDGDEVLLLDMDNGRELTGMKLEAGMHQAIEAKEGVPITKQTRSMASITFQNFFKMFKKLSGMTGTAITAAHEFISVYNLPVIQVPTHKPNIRKDEPDILYLNLPEKIDAVVKMIKDNHEKGRPVLIETGSVSLSRLYSRALLREGIVHNVLNAQSEAKEAPIIEDAGQPGAVTIATSMAGRGTDIKLGMGVDQMGGLLVIGTERMDNQRIDNQLRGRAGRQGDPGETVFFSSLMDKVVIQNAPDWVEYYRHRLERKEQLGQREIGLPLTNRRAQHVVTSAQRISENTSERDRENAIKYDDILRIQREIVYAFRNKIIASEDLSNVLNQIKDNAVKLETQKQNLSTQQIAEYIINNVDYNFQPDEFLGFRDSTQIKAVKFLSRYISRQLKKQFNKVEGDFQETYMIRLGILKALDNTWIEQVDNIQQLRSVVGNRGSGLHNPVFEYEREAKRSFENMKRTFWRLALKNICLSDIVKQKDGSFQIDFP